MRSSKARAALALLGATVALVAMSIAGPASASAASFSPSANGTTISGTVTWKRNGLQPISCAFRADRTTGPWNDVSPMCNGQLINGGSWGFVPFANVGGTFSVHVLRGYAFARSPYGTAYNDPGGMGSRVPFLNGNSTTPSTIVFNNTPIGVEASTGATITWTGTLNMKVTATGAPVVIVP